MSPKVDVRATGSQALAPALSSEKGSFSWLPRSSLLWELNAFDKKPELF